jgi:hypothetical protein
VHEEACACSAQPDVKVVYPRSHAPGAVSFSSVSTAAGVTTRAMLPATVSTGFGVQSPQPGVPALADSGHQLRWVIAVAPAMHTRRQAPDLVERVFGPAITIK